MKRQRVDGHINNGDGYIPYIERLYRKTQGNYDEAGGFMEDDDEYEDMRERFAESRRRRLNARANAANLVPPDECADCAKPLYESFLWDNFNYPVCNACRDDKGKHKLLSRTEAKSQYLLKDCDLDLRKPILRYISRKNPHNPRYGDMKLYLTAQLEQRCLEVHGSKEALEKAKELRASQKESRLEKRFEKKIKEMRQQVRGPKGWRAGKNKAHEHVYGEENYDAEKDEYEKVCTTCGYKMRYEKM